MRNTRFMGFPLLGIQDFSGRCMQCLLPVFQCRASVCQLIHPIHISVSLCPPSLCGHDPDPYSFVEQLVVRERHRHCSHIEPWASLFAIDEYVVGSWYIEATFRCICGCSPERTSRLAFCRCTLDPPFRIHPCRSNCQFEHYSCPNLHVCRHQSVHSGRKRVVGPE